MYESNLCFQVPKLILNNTTKYLFFKVVDSETDEILGPNQPGELRVKSKTVMNSYYKRDCSNRWDKDGWFRTGDVVQYDEDCYFYVVDRLKEMLKYRGWHIPPAILELELSHHPAIRQSVVIGMYKDVILIFYLLNFIEPDFILKKIYIN